MSWAILFQAANLLALAAWALLILGPRGALAGALVMYGGVAMLCLAYVGALALLLSGAADPGGAGGAPGETDFTTMAGARAIFEADPYFRAGVWQAIRADEFLGVAGDWVGGAAWKK
ncbi:MAG: abscisic acid-deficient protein Aba4 family protein [Erythrobacter sp.]